jgi:hypothetical protein
MITKENIEAYLLDFLEGNLNADELLELETFLIENPTFKPDFELLQLDQDSQFEFNKESLKKNPIFDPIEFQEIKEGTIEEKMFVAATENVLSETELIHFKNQLIEKPVAQIEFTIYQKTRLEADNSIVFPNLSQLKRKETNVFPFSWLAKLTAAASIVGICCWLFLGSNSMHRNVSTKKAPNLRNETKHRQVEKSIQNAENIPHIRDYKLNQQQLPNSTSVQTKDSLIEPKEILSPPIEMAIVNNFLDTNASKTYLDKNEVLPMNELAKILPNTNNSLTPIEFVNAKMKKRFFGKDNPSKEEMYASISKKLSTVFGISFVFFRTQENGNRSLYFRIGKFSIEKK